MLTLPLASPLLATVASMLFLKPTQLPKSPVPLQKPMVLGADQEGCRVGGERP